MSARTSIAISTRDFWDRPDGKPIDFIILLIVVILSLPLTTFVLYQLLTKRTVYSQMNNHVIIILIISNALQTIVEMPMQLSFWYLGVVWPPSLAYCYVWSFIEYFMFTANALLMAWASFERHLLIFNGNLFHSVLRRICYHFVPIGLCFVYPLAYYIGFLFFYPCASYYDMANGNCITGCFVWTSHVMNIYEQTCHGFIPTLLIGFLSTSLLWRVLRKKRRLAGGWNWRKNRKMTIQLLSISRLFFFVNIGFYSINIVQKMGNSDFGSALFSWTYLIALCLPPLIPLVSLACLPEIWSKIPCFHRLGRTITIQPMGKISSLMKPTQPTTRRRARALQ